MRLLVASVIAALPLTAVIASPASGQAQVTQPEPVTWIGKKIFDPKDGEVGMVTAFKQGMVIVKTDKHEASLPPTSFTYQKGKLYFGMTRDQLNAEMDKIVAASAASMAVGATVKGSAGGAVGTIETIDEEFVMIKLVSGKFVKIPRSGIVGTPDGAVIGMTAEALEELVASGG